MRGRISVTERRKTGKPVSEISCRIEVAIAQRGPLLESCHVNAVTLCRDYPTSPLKLMVTVRRNNPNPFAGVKKREAVEAENHGRIEMAKGRIARVLEQTEARPLSEGPQ
jgi:hypothetical protein